MPDTKFMCPVKHLLRFVSSCTVTLRGIDTQHFCIAPVSVLDDSDMIRNMPALHPEKLLVERVNKRPQDHTGVTSTTMPPFG